MATMYLSLEVFLGKPEPGNPEFEVYQILKKPPVHYSVLPKRLRYGPPLIQILIQPVFFQEARELFRCRTKPNLPADSELPELGAKFRQTGMLRRDESLLEIQNLTGLAMVERLHPARFQIHLNPMLELRQPLPLEIVMEQEGHLARGLMDFDQVRLRHVAKQCRRAAQAWLASGADWG